MKAIGMGVAVVLAALAIAPAAFADGSGGPGGAQAGVQAASTAQGALGVALSHQNAVNANVPVSIAGGNITSGPSSATQTATSNANADVSNKAKTDQDQTLNQNIGGSGCKAGCGGAGGFQAGVQAADTKQIAVGVAKSDQNAVNANVPVNIAGGNVNSGPSDATQTATSTANTDVKNKSKTDQDQTLNQNIGGSGSCKAGCGGAGGFQAGVQAADTKQAAVGIAKSDQNAVNANVPVNIAGGNVNSGPSSATQTATSTASADVKNKSKTDQDQTQNQNIGGSGCYAGCGGSGGFQLGVQKADTGQLALGLAKSDQNAVNGNAPVSIAGGDITSGPSSATQTATSTADTDVKNKAKTDQDQTLNQNIGSDEKSCSCEGRTPQKDDSCSAGCGGAGGFQLGVQKAETNQFALGLAKSDQNAVNGNAPVSIAGGNVTSGPSDATQTATSTANADVKNKAKTDQDQTLTQNIGGSGCYVGCGGPGGFQLGVQKAETHQGAIGAALSDQNAVNGNAPVSIAGGDINSGPSSATQTATSTADTDVENKAKTDQDQGLEQNIGNSDMKAPVLCSCEGAKKDKVGRQNDRKSGKYGKKGRKSGSPSRTATPTGNSRVAYPLGNSRTTGTLGNNAHRSGTLGNEASKSTPNDKGSGNNSSSGGGIPNAKRDSRKGSCLVGCGGAGGFQLGIQGAETKQGALGIAKSHQNAVNSNAPSSEAGKDISGGPSNATQTATSSANADVKNKAKTDQHQDLHQNIGDSGCVAGCGGAGGFQAGVQLSKTKQLALGFGISDQNAVNGNTPHSVAGGNIYDGGSNATQTATSTGNTDVKNKGKTDQNQWEDQLL
jgi:hypothetical protein